MKRSEKIFQLYLKALKLEKRWASTRRTAFLWRELANDICDQHGVILEEVLTRSKNRIITQARQHIMYELRHRGWSLMQIGKVLNRDHTTIIFGIKAHEKRLIDV